MEPREPVMLPFRPTLFFTIIISFILIAFATLQLGDELSVVQQWHLLKGAEPQEFADFNFVYAQLPRLLMAIMVGAMLGLVGSLMQQLTQNSLTSPLTLGTSSGAWLALIVANVWFPGLAADHMALLAMVGAIFAMGLVITIAGPKNITGLPLILSGMVVNILFGAIATSIILLNDQYAKRCLYLGSGRFSAKWLGHGSLASSSLIRGVTSSDSCAANFKFNAIRPPRRCRSWLKCYTVFHRVDWAWFMVSFRFNYSGWCDQFYWFTLP